MAVDGEVALFSMIKWLCFQLSRCKQDGPNGPLFGDQMALFSVDKNSPPDLTVSPYWRKVLSTDNSH